MKNYNEILVNKIKEVELDYIGSLTNVKLHAVAYEVNSDRLQYEFEQFCQTEWENYEEYLKDNYCEAKTFSRTSSFQIDCDDTLDGNGNLAYFVGKNNNDKLTYIVECFEDKYGWDLDETDEGAMEEIEDDEEIFDENVEEFIENLNAIVKAYKYVEDFKNKQLVHWNDWLENVYAEED